MKRLILYFELLAIRSLFMQKEREYLSEELKRLADRIREAEALSELKNLKGELLRVYEELVLITHEAESPAHIEQSPADIEQSPAHIEPGPEAERISEPESVTVPEEEAVGSEDVPEEQEYPTLSDLFVPTFNDIKEDMSQKEEFKDTVSLDETEKLFETKKEEIRQLSLNDKLVGSSIQVGLNDRIAFVNKLFNFSQSDFNKVLGRLNACSTREEALHYVQYEVKTNYNWRGKEDLEERFISLIERKFMT